MNEVEAKRLANVVRETSYALHVFLKHGHMEKVYENGLRHRLMKQGLSVAQQVPLKVCDDDGAVLGDYVADLVIGGSMIVEIKACKTLAEEHTAQVLGYLRATGLEHAILVNFGAPKLQIRKFARMEAKPD